MENVNKNTEIDNTDKKLIISDVMNSILVDMLNEMYDIGIEEGSNIFYNTECSFGKDDIYEIIGKEKSVEQLLKKYCS
jgi:hypothetical protein